MTPHRTPPPPDLHILCNVVGLYIQTDTVGTDNADGLDTLIRTCEAASPEARAILAPILALWWIHPGDTPINLAAPWSHAVLRVLAETAYAYRHKHRADLTTSAMMLDAADMPGEWRAALFPLVRPQRNA